MNIVDYYQNLYMGAQRPWKYKYDKIHSTALALYWNVNITMFNNESKQSERKNITLFIKWNKNIY